ncbi:hypothetical protein BJ742DRAFT_259673 [Cladochytrium replicatum]|nr:hypothetical protein BJ742DRAFT_259673 [Cladochytrium replicatum]
MMRHAATSATGSQNSRFLERHSRKLEIIQKDGSSAQMDARMLRQEWELAGSLPQRGKQLASPHPQQKQQRVISSSSNKARGTENLATSGTPPPQPPPLEGLFEKSIQLEIKSLRKWDPQFVAKIQSVLRPQLARMLPIKQTPKSAQYESKFNLCRRCFPWITQSETNCFALSSSSLDHSPTHLFAPQRSYLPMIPSVNNAPPPNQRRMRSVTSTTASNSSVIKNISNSSVIKNISNSSEPDWRVRAYIHAQRKKSNSINLSNSINSRVLDRIHNRLLQHIQFKAYAAERSNRSSFEVRPTISFENTLHSSGRPIARGSNSLNRRTHSPSISSTTARMSKAPRSSVLHGLPTDLPQSNSQLRQRSELRNKRPWKQKPYETKNESSELSTDNGSVRDVPYTPSESLSGWDSEIHWQSSPTKSRRAGVPPVPLILGGLGPDKESEAYKTKLALRLKQKQYAEVLRQQLPVTTKPPPLKPRSQTPTKREKMLAYASALPPPNTVASSTLRPRKERERKAVRANDVEADADIRRLIELDHEHELNMQVVERIRRELKL